MKVLQLIFCVCYFFLTVGCSSESDKTGPDESAKESISEPQIKSVEKVTLEPQIKQLEKATEVNTPITKSTNNLRKKAEKRTNSKLVKDSVEVVPWDIVPGKNWAKPTWEEENWPED